jgi:predicted transcriptional regulator
MEKLSVRGMIESILQDMAENRPVDSYVLKIQMVSKMLKNEKLSSWIDKELNGYEEINELPPYRVLKTQIIANLIIDHGIKAAKLTNHEMPLYVLGTEKADELSTLYIKDPIIKLCKLTKLKGYSLSNYEKHWLSTIYEYSNILSAYKPVSLSNIDVIIHKFKSTLLDIFMELNDTIFNDEIDFDIMAKRTQIEKIVNQTINAGIVNMGNGYLNANDSTNIGGQNNSVVINNKLKDEIERVVAQIKEVAETFVDEKEEVLTELARIRIQLNKPSPKISTISSAFQTINAILIGVAGNMATPVVIESVKHVLSLIGG